MSSRRSDRFANPDSAENQHALSYLRKAGFAVLTAQTGEVALEAIRTRTSRIDWLYTDIKLPGTIDGWVVGAEFHIGHPSRPIVYATASAPPSRTRTAQSLFIRKPFDPQIVVDFFVGLAEAQD